MHVFQVLDFDFEKFTDGWKRKVYLNQFNNKLTQKWAFRKNEFIAKAYDGPESYHLRLDAYQSHADNGAEVGIYRKKMLNGMNQLWDLVYEEDSNPCKNVIKFQHLHTMQFSTIDT